MVLSKQHYDIGYILNQVFETLKMKPEIGFLIFFTEKEKEIAKRFVCSGLMEHIWELFSPEDKSGYTIGNGSPQRTILATQTQWKILRQLSAIQHGNLGSLVFSARFGLGSGVI